MDNYRPTLKHQLQNLPEVTMKMKLLMVIYLIIIAKMKLKCFQSLLMVHLYCLDMMMTLKKIKQVILKLPYHAIQYIYALSMNIFILFVAYTYYLKF